MNNLSRILFTALIAFLLTSCNGGKENLNIQEKEESNIYKYSAADIDGGKVNLSEYKGKVLLIVNVASECGYTPQYEGLQNLYREYQNKGLEILAFPCNDFMGQEPGTSEEIKYFCEENYSVTFKLFDKITLSGENKSELFETLTNNPRTGNSSIYWNFEKFIIDKNGYIVDRFRSPTEPESDDIKLLIEKLLAES